MNLALREEGYLDGWRDEYLPVVQNFNAAPAFLVERCACAHYGMKGYGVHLNAYVRDETGAVSHLWVATRSQEKQTWPGM